MKRPLILITFAAASVLALGAGCASTTARWHAGAFPSGGAEEAGEGRDPSAVEVYYKQEFGLLDETESRELFACSTTTVLRRAMLLEEAGEGEGELRARPGRPERSWRVVGHVTTEEFPRDATRSAIHGDTFSNWFGIGSHPEDLWEVHLDPDAREGALERLRYHAARLGADAVIDVFASGEAEFHMWKGGAISFNTRSTRSPIRASGELLDFQLRDVRLHGTAVRYD